MVHCEFIAHRGHIWGEEVRTSRAKTTRITRSGSSRSPESEHESEYTVKSHPHKVSSPVLPPRYSRDASAVPSLRKYPRATSISMQPLPPISSVACWLQPGPGRALRTLAKRLLEGRFVLRRPLIITSLAVELELAMHAPTDRLAGGAGEDLLALSPLMRDVCLGFIACFGL